ncbi:MAG: hypothetical protein ACOC8X_03560 [Chloroflexota bacterium]
MSVAVENLPETTAHLQRVEMLERRLVRPMHKAVDLTFVRVLLTTPVDTGRLEGSMDKLVLPRGTEVRGMVFSSGAYGPYGHRYDHYVKHDEHQAWMHRGRVATMGEDLEAVTPQVLGLFDDTVEVTVGT